MKRLTDEQRARAEGSYHLAEACASRACRPGLDRDVLLSQASWGLLYAAARWDPAASPQGEAGWGAFAVQTISWAILRLWRPRSKDRLWLEPCGQQVPEFALNSAADRREPPGRLEAAEEVEAGMRMLPPRERELLWAVRAEGVPVADAGAALGLRRGTDRAALALAEETFRLARFARYQRTEGE